MYDVSNEPRGDITFDDNFRISEGIITKVSRVIERRARMLKIDQSFYSLSVFSTTKQKKVTFK